MSPDTGGDVARATLWDASADERQRLADERQQLADERERLADERERLADEHERRLDERYAELAGSGTLDAVLADEIARAEAEGRVARAEARLERSIAERDGARLALEREGLSQTRHAADTEAARRALEPKDDGGWDVERRNFVAAERDRLANLRDDAHNERDDVADRREHEADERDRQHGQREQQLEILEGQAVQGGTSADDVQRARRDLAEVREQAIRQRRIAARAATHCG